MCRPIVKTVGLGTGVSRIGEVFRRRQKAGIEAGIADPVQAAPGAAAGVEFQQFTAVGWL
jgi:hypothetical protein